MNPKVREVQVGQFSTGGVGHFYPGANNVPKRIRGVLADETIIDTRRGRMLHETGELIQWYVPLEDVLHEALRPSFKRTSDPYKGDATFYNVCVGERVEPDAAWSYAGALQRSLMLRGFITFDFDRLDAWFEEDDQILGHPRDPYRRFDCRHTSEHVEVRVGGETIADTRRAIKLFETSMQPRYYISAEDVKPDALTPSDTRTLCPYKGEAAYYDVRGGAQTLTDGAWTLPAPYGEAVVTLGHVSFWGDDLEIHADGKRV